MKKYILCMLLTIWLMSCRNIQTINNGIDNEQLTSEEENVSVVEEISETKEDKASLDSTPDVFLPEMVSLNPSKESTSMYAVGHMEFYFSRVDQDINQGLASIWKTTILEGQWQEPELFIHSEDAKNFNPFMTPDEKYLLFYRMYNTETEENRNGTYYIERTEEGWSNLVFLIDEYCVTTADFQTFYASPIKGDYKNDIIQFEYNNGEIVNLKPLSGIINTSFLETHPTISPDESFLIFDSNRPESMDRGDMYISFKLSNNTWGEGVNLGELVNQGLSGNPSISTDGIRLFYSLDGDIYFIELKELLTMSITSTYFDQELPGNSPEIFAKDTISKTDLLQYPVSFSKDGLLMFYGQMDSNRNRHLLYSENIDGTWSEPKQIEFTSSDEMEPIISPDGNRIYFASSYDTNLQKPSDLYYVTYNNGLFTDPVKLPETINSNQTEYFVSQSLNGNLYFTREGVGIFKSELVDGSYQEAYQLEFDSSYYYISHPFIAKDESFIVFDARHSDNIGSADLFISFNSEMGFGKPINLGDKINSENWDAMASLAPNEDYLFFVREEGSQRDVYWVEFNSDEYLGK